jgi:hypothetical protein
MEEHGKALGGGWGRKKVRKIKRSRRKEMELK